MSRDSTDVAPSSPYAVAAQPKGIASQLPPSAAGASFAIEQASIKPTSLTREAFRRFVANRLALASGVVIIFLFVLAVVANYLPLQSPFHHGSDFNTDSPPSPQHWMGTDGAGLDEFSRMIYGLRPAFAVGLIGQVITTILGVSLGVIAGYYGGWIDSMLARVTDLFFAFPSFLLAFLVVGLFGPQFAQYGGGTGSVIMITIVFALVGWPGLMRFVRSLTLSLKEQQFVEAARTIGTPNWKIIVRHILPSTWGLVLVQTTFGVGAYIGNEAILSLLGLGVQKPNADLGVMVDDGIGQLTLNSVEAIAPSILLTVVIVAFAFVGDGLRDAIDPRGNE
jgi:ABC-type dipeptide/oligopeptide/nickel transport system permease subunit